MPIVSSVSSRLVVVVKEGVIDVRPKLMKHEGAGIDTYVQNPSVYGVAEVSLALRIVEV